MVKLNERTLADEPLWALLLEARKGDERFQIVVFPPAWTSQYRQIHSQHKGTGRYMRRTLDGTTKGSHWEQWNGPLRSMTARLKSTVGMLEDQGWTWLEPVPMPVKEDEYVFYMWDGTAKTPQTLVRHLDEWLADNRGYRMTGPAGDAV